MQLAIHTYGHIDAMFYVLNGIAMLMNHSVTMMIIEMTALVSVSYYGLKMAYAGSSGQHKAYLMKVAAMVLMINAALLPKAEMLIIDHVSKKKEKVDNLPLGFAVPVGLLEAFGDILTAGFEQAFTGLKTANYRDYGMVFGARLVQEARNWRIKNPEFIQNMHAYMTRCVVRDAMIGYHYTASDLLTTGDIWKLVSSNAGTLRKVDMRKGKEWELVSCKEAAVKYIAPAFSSEIKQLAAKSKNSEFALATSNEKLSPRSSEVINNMLGKNIELVFGSYLGVSSSAEELIKQQMMINALSYIGNDYGYARASMQQESNWQIAGDLANTYLPILLTVIKGLLYSSFMFMVPLMLLSGGGARYLNYLLVVGSLQLWPALNSVLNMFIDLYSSSALSDIADSIVSFSTFSQVGNYADKIVAVASGLQMSVPFLAFAIVQGGVGGFIHLAGNITGASQAAASSVASEVATGNRSIDNVSASNRQIGIQSGFKSDWNQAYSSGASSYQHMDGTMERVVGSGEMMLQSGAGLTVSGGSSRFNVTESVSSQLEQSLSNAQSLMDSDQRAYSKASATTFDNTASLVASLAKRESNGESIDYGMAGEHGRSLQQAVSQTRQLNEKYDYGWRQAAETSLEAGLSGTFSKIGGLPFAGVKGGIDLSSVASNLSEQSVSDNNQLSRENNTHVDYSSVVKAASNEQFARSNNIDTSYSDDIRKNYQEQQSLEGQIAKRAEQIETYNRALSHVQTKDASFEQDMYHVLEQKVASAYGVSTKDAHDMIERGDPRVIAVKQRMISDEVSNYLPVIEGGRERTAPNTSKEKLEGFNTRYQRQYDYDRQRQSQVDPFYSQDIQDMAKRKGIDTSNRELREDVIGEKASALIHDNTQEINQVQKQNQQTEERLHEQVKQYESQRFSKYIGIGGATNPATIEKPIEAASKIVGKGRVSSKKHEQPASSGEAVKNNMAMDTGELYSEPEQKASQVKKKQEK